MLGLKLRSEVGFFFVSEGIDLLRILGWIVTFMLDVRGGGPSSEHVSSGFSAVGYISSLRLGSLPHNANLKVSCSVMLLYFG
jgi:hypothetical protein